MIRILVALILALVPMRAALAQQLVVPQPLLTYTDDVIDYRPAINGAGTRIVFERQTFDVATKAYGPVNLFVSDIGGANPVRLLTDLSPTTRPDWCRYPGRPNVDGQIAFTQGNTGPIYIVAAKPGPAGTPVPNTTNSIYPTWYPGCQQLAVDSIQEVSVPAGVGPGTLKVSPKTGRVEQKLTGKSLWAGFPSVDPVAPGLIAFAGQQFKLPSAPCQEPGYQQNCNYIYLAAGVFSSPQIFPLESDAWTNVYNPKAQGRAPSWSPDGRWIVFESDRVCNINSGHMAIFLADAKHRQSVRQVTDCAYNGQHAKWYLQRADGQTKLVVSVLRYPCSDGTSPGFPACQTGDPKTGASREIASLDVTAFVAPARAVKTGAK